MAISDRLHTTPVDAVLAVVFVVTGLVQVALVPIADHGAGPVYVVGSMLPLAWRRTYPVMSAFVSSLFWLIPLTGFPLLGFVAVVLQFYALGSRGRPDRLVLAVTAWAAITSAVGTLLGPELPVAAIGAVLVVVAPVVAGRLMLYQRRRTEEISALTRELRNERLRAEEAAVLSERARIARELHDVVGHEVTLIAIQAEAAAAALQRSPDKAVAPVEAIRSTAHETMVQIRQVLDMLAPLHEEEGPDDRDLANLADHARSVGIANTLTVTGAPPPERSRTVFAVNRIVRECLTNAGRHAPGERVDIVVDWLPDRVQLCSTNRTTRSAPLRPGRGLSGIRHRAELLGGTFESRVDRGRFDVRVAIPFGAGAS
ncbi:histidine kinase [Aldersonia sp. NBC_00410]|uniref:sensor histidine kinase n=1 Tax=Aldersonia sp. NBC_00410 TaxID=2975954 RepID=UPI0022512644|nr:histidine kinase [Aldersonia sp. NBC_00410]MCX5042849.1 histidine kinase [Aldersonia sp. NBC_00410]